MAYLAAARGWWHFPSYLILPLLGVGFCVAGLVSSLTYAVRRHRARDAEPAEGEQARLR
ncbi:hypothetical protein [Streptomyces orinoci]|uniref:Uncharacterized protein n=1 Tax=Streptomyces orinoci TaxID=67339 RepID=A0ABV3JUM4_STRON|nr:hypothetical protein [Streptomyces orinoci]